MSRYITFFSFRRGAGKSSLVANTAAILASQGWRVGVVDIDFQAPCLHIFFGIPEDEITYTFNDYLWNRCEIQQTVYDVGPRIEYPISGQLMFVPSSTRVADILYTLRNPLDFDHLSEGLGKLATDFDLDLICLDTTAGLNEDTLVAMAISNILVIILRPEQQEFQGTAVTVEVVKNLPVQRICMVMNDVPNTLETEQARAELEEIYQCEIAALFPHSEEMMVAGSKKIIAFESFSEPYVKQLYELVRHLVLGSPKNANDSPPAHRYAA